MTQPAQCPQCAAPLAPGAPKCAFCGFLTPWGAAAVAHQQQFAAHQQQQAVLFADRDRRLRLMKIESGARTGMILALVGLPFCCIPISLAGGVMGYMATKRAQTEGQPRPTMAVIAMVVAALSVVLFAVALGIGAHEERIKAEQVAEVRARLAGKREGQTLEPKAACDVVEEYLLQKGYEGTKYDREKGLHCDGALTFDGRRATIHDVRFAGADKRFTVNACFERRARWFVLTLDEDDACAGFAPPAPYTPPPRKLSEEEIAADEQKVRDGLLKSRIP